MNYRRIIVSNPVSVPDFFATICAALAVDYSKYLYDGDRPVPITDNGVRFPRCSLNACSLEGSKSDWFCVRFSRPRLRHDRRSADFIPRKQTALPGPALSPREALQKLQVPDVFVSN